MACSTVEFPTFFRGVRFRRDWKLTRPWTAQIRHQHKLIHLGYFASDEEAARAYDKKARELHGERAKLNFPDDQP